MALVTGQHQETALTFDPLVFRCLSLPGGISPSTALEHQLWKYPTPAARHLRVIMQHNPPAFRDKLTGLPCVPPHLIGLDLVVVREVQGGQEEMDELAAQAGRVDVLRQDLAEEVLAGAGPAME